MRAIFGPVLSRRLGRSLGIDPLISKHCDWSCIYCQLGRTRHKCTARLFHRSVEETLRELGAALDEAEPGTIDWITIVGSGEPTLELALGDLIRGIRQRTRIPLALITNGSLLGWPDLREEIAAADAVLPSLDAGSEELFQRINRPAKGLSLESHVAGLSAFRRMYTGRLWVEVMLLHALNTGDEALAGLARQIERIAPDAVHVVLPTRPPAESWVRPATSEEVERATRMLSQAAPVLPPGGEGILGTLGHREPVERAVELVTRHPVRYDEMRASLRAWSGGDGSHALDELKRDPRVTTIRRGDALFWVSTEGDFTGERSEP